MCGIAGIENAILIHLSEDTAFSYKLWEPETTSIVLGRGSDAEKEVSLQACTEDGIAIQRRKGGGCTVLLDSGMVIITLGFYKQRLKSPSLWFNKINSTIITLLSALNINNLSQMGISDICIGNKKVLGGCLHISQDKALYQGSLLVNCCLEKIEKYLQHPVKEPNYRAGRIHMDFLTSLAKEGYALSTHDIIKSLEKGLTTAAFDHRTLGLIQCSNDLQFCL